VAVPSLRNPHVFVSLAEIWVKVPGGEVACS
jgi:hypothetical protein